VSTTTTGRKKETATYIDHSERDEYPKVSPTMGIHDGEGREQELVGGPETATLHPLVASSFKT
jgi:hypothetical protein